MGITHDTNSTVNSKVTIYKWEDLRQPIIDKMVEFLKVPFFTYKKYVMIGIPKFPDGKSDKYLHEYITWLRSNTTIIDELLNDEICFIIQNNNTKILFAFNEIVYSCNFAETIP